MFWGTSKLAQNHVCFKKKSLRNSMQSIWTKKWYCASYDCVNEKLSFMSALTAIQRKWKLFVWQEMYCTVAVKHIHSLSSFCRFSLQYNDLFEKVGSGYYDTIYRRPFVPARKPSPIISLLHVQVEHWLCHGFQLCRSRAPLRYFPVESGIRWT